MGLDTIINNWLRQQIAYRQNMVMDLMTIAMTVEEVRAPIHHIISEVFRKGITWAPKFAVKCGKCNTEYQDAIKECPECKTDGSLYEPDEGQKERFGHFLDDCNIFDNSLEEIKRVMQNFLSKVKSFPIKSEVHNSNFVLKLALFDPIKSEVHNSTLPLTYPQLL